LHGGGEIWLEFARELGAINRSEQTELEQRSRQALKEVATLQSSDHQANDPARHVMTLLRAALLGGRAHVAGRRGEIPESPERWGWRRGRLAWVAQGTRIGWLIADDVYLNPALSHQIACEIAGAQQLSISVYTLSRRLHQQGLLATIGKHPVNTTWRGGAAGGYWRHASEPRAKARVLAGVDREATAKRHSDSNGVRATPVSEYSFYQWRKQLAQQLPVKFALVETNRSVPVRAAVELTLASGERLRIEPGVDGATLRMVLGVLRAPR